MTEDIIVEINNAVINYDEDRVVKAAKKSLELGIDPLMVIRDGLMQGMKVVGDKFEAAEYFLPEVMMAADAMEKALGILKPMIKADQINEVKRATVVIGTVKGDIHEIGKNLVATLLKINGFEVYDIGRDKGALDFIQKAQETNSNIVALSALMTTTMIEQKDFIELSQDTGVRDKYMVMVGGGPVTEQWAEEIGADGYGKTAEDAVRIAKTIIEKGGS